MFWLQVNRSYLGVLGAHRPLRVPAGPAEDSTGFQGLVSSRTHTASLRVPRPEKYVKQWPYELCIGSEGLEP